MFSHQRIAHLQNHPTPFYVYDLNLLDKTLSAMNAASSKYNFHVHYALKANSNREILNHICKSGMGADCVSGNEIKRALETGFSADKIVVAGVGKSDAEIRFGLANEIFSFNCESLPEL